jgi:hypothetical protein
MVESNQPSDSQQRKIKIKQLQGSDIELQVNKDIPVPELKKLIEEKSGVPAG